MDQELVAVVVQSNSEGMEIRAADLVGTAVRSAVKALSAVKERLVDLVRTEVHLEVNLDSLVLELLLSVQVHLEASVLAQMALSAVFYSRPHLLADREWVRSLRIETMELLQLLLQRVQVNDQCKLRRKVLELKTAVSLHLVAKVQSQEQLEALEVAVGCKTELEASLVESGELVAL